VVGDVILAPIPPRDGFHLTVTLPHSSPYSAQRFAALVERPTFRDSDERDRRRSAVVKRQMLR
jgi:hypothetical protein